jgi:hypothetical protein
VIDRGRILSAQVAIPPFLCAGCRSDRDHP